MNEKMAKKRTKTSAVPPTGKLALIDIRLMESSSKLGGLKPNQLPGEAQQPIEFTLMRAQDNTKNVCAQAKIGLHVSYEDRSDEPVISVMAVFRANYIIVEDFSSEEFLNIFLKNVGMGNIWPYWREFAQSMTIRMGLPSFPIPLVNTSELFKEENVKG